MLILFGNLRILWRSGILEYARPIVVFHSRFKKDVDQIERVHRRATKLISGLRNMSYEHRLTVMNLTSLVYRRHRGDMIEVYKYLHEMYSLRCDSLLRKTSPSALRGHDYKLFKRQCHSELRLNFFFPCCQFMEQSSRAGSMCFVIKCF